MKINNLFQHNSLCASFPVWNGYKSSLFPAQVLLLPKLKKLSSFVLHVVGFYLHLVRFYLQLVLIYFQNVGFYLRIVRFYLHMCGKWEPFKWSDALRSPPQWIMLISEKGCEVNRGLDVGAARINYGNVGNFPPPVAHTLCLVKMVMMRRGCDCWR